MTTIPINLLTPAMLDQIILWQDTDPDHDYPCEPSDDAQVLLDAILDCGIELPRTSRYDLSTWDKDTDIPIVLDSMAHRWVVMALVRAGQVFGTQSILIVRFLTAAQTWALSPTMENKRVVVNYMETVNRGLDTDTEWGTAWEDSTLSANIRAVDFCTILADIVSYGIYDDVSTDPPNNGASLSEMLDYYVRASMQHALYAPEQDPEGWARGVDMAVRRVTLLCLLSDFLPEPVLGKFRA